MECVNKIKVDSSECLKPCSGLIITTLSKSEKEVVLDKSFPIFEDYDNYKKITEFPTGLQGKIVISLN